MDNKKQTSHIIKILQAAGLEISTETIEGIPVTVARGIVLEEPVTTSDAMVAILTPFLKKKVKLYFYIPLGEVDDISVQTIDQFSDRARDFCKAANKVDKKQKKHKSKGSICIPILLSGNADSEAKGWVMKTTKAKWSIFTMPTIIDLNSNEIFFRSDTPFVGLFIYKIAKELIDTVIRKALAGIELN